ncbi:MAG: polymer-forming cytoskeletal protein [Acidiferrobacterales bacterium]
MFDTPSKKLKPCSAIDVLISGTAEVKGDITFDGGLRVDAKVEGDIVAKGKENSTLIVSECAEIGGNVTVPFIILLGKIRGSVHCTEHIRIHPNAEITGDVHYKSIDIAAGAAINGKLERETAKKTEKITVTKLKPAAASAEASA